MFWCQFVNHFYGVQFPWSNDFISHFFLSVRLHKVSHSAHTLFMPPLVQLVFLCKTLWAIFIRTATSPHFHESAASPDTTQLFLSPWTTWQSNSLRFWVGPGLPPSRQIFNEGANRLALKIQQKKNWHRAFSRDQLIHVEEDDCRHVSWPWLDLCWSCCLLISQLG